MVYGANAALRFLLELTGVAALSYWGVRVGPTAATSVALGIGAPALLIVVWAVLVAPKAVNPVPQRARMLTGTGLLALTAFALVLAGQPVLGVALAGMVAVNGLFLTAVMPRL